MTWEILVSLIVAITGLGTFIWGIVKHYDKKREKKATEQQNFMGEMRTEIQNSHEFIKEMREENKKQSQNIESMQNEIKDIKKDLKSVHTQLKNQKELIDENEMSRLQTAIMDFANFLRNGHFMTLNSFNYIFHEYDKYKALNGNTFIDSEFEFIKQKKKEFNFNDEAKNNIK